MHGFKKRLVVLWVKWDRAINLASLVLGFVFDLFLAKRPDSVADNLLLIFYLLVSGAIIIALNVRSMRRGLEQSGPTRPLLFILILQFCFGGLASNLLILYGKSGTVSESLLFVGLLAAFALGNEFLKNRYDQLRFNVVIYYFLLFTYCVIALPTFVLHTIGAGVFLLSGVVSLVCIAVFLWLLFFAPSWRIRTQDKQKLYEVSMLVLITFGIFNGLYFLNILPPVPLALKSIGIYHTLQALPAPDVAGNLYTATYERPAWYVFWRDTSDTFIQAADTSTMLAANQGAYCYSAVFAPGQLSTPIAHRWEYYDAATGVWQTESLVSFPINGGRAEGYRGWSFKAAPMAGRWRCDVESGRGQLIGRITFVVSEAPGAPTLSTTAL